MRKEKMIMAWALLLACPLVANAMPSAVYAVKAYKVQATKTAYVYTAKGKKTKTSYKKGKVLTAYRIKKIKGKSYYDLGKGRYILVSYAKKYSPKKAKKPSTSRGKTVTQKMKLTRVIYLYKPTGTSKVSQNAYVKRTATINPKTGKIAYSAWKSSSWKAYTVPKIAGYTAITKTVPSEKVYSWTKNKVVTVQYAKDVSQAPNIKLDSTINQSKGKVEWTEATRRKLEQRDFTLLNSLRKAVGLAPFKLATSRAKETDARASERLDNYIKTDQLNHGGLENGQYENLKAYRDPNIKTESMLPTTAGLIDLAYSETKKNWIHEKTIYQKSGYSWHEYGHYGQIIFPYFTKVSIGSAFAYKNGNMYFLVAERFYY